MTRIDKSKKTDEKWEKQSWTAESRNHKKKAKKINK